MCVAFAVGAQTAQIDLGLYNPDADQDSLIGTTDLEPLLALYGGEFELEILFEDVALVDVILSMQATIGMQAQERSRHSQCQSWPIT